jgi:hypothetical protein
MPWCIFAVPMPPRYRLELTARLFLAERPRPSGALGRSHCV